MNKLFAFATCAALAATLGVTPARAEGNETVARSGPNRALLRSGIVALGVPYAASVFIAFTSDHEGDKSLYLPVPETHTTTAEAPRTWIIRPAHLAAGGYGLSASGRF